MNHKAINFGKIIPKYYIKIKKKVMENLKKK